MSLTLKREPGGILLQVRQASTSPLHKAPPPLRSCVSDQAGLDAAAAAAACKLQDNAAAQVSDLGGRGRLWPLKHAAVSGGLTHGQPCIDPKTVVKIQDSLHLCREASAHFGLRTATRVLHARAYHIYTCIIYIYIYPLSENLKSTRAYVRVYIYIHIYIYISMYIPASIHARLPRSCRRGSS